MNEKTPELLTQPFPVYAYNQQEEEINLIDLWITLSRYRTLFFIVATAVLLAGIYLSYFVYNERHTLVSMIQIGTIEKQNNRIPLESPDSLLSKINSSIVPGYSGEWLVKNGIDSAPKTDVSVPKGSEIVVIGNKIKKTELELFSGFQQGLVKQIIDDHDKVINSYKAPLISNLEIAQLKLEELKAPITLDIQLKAHQIRLEEEKNKLKKLQDNKFFGIKKNEFQNKIVVGDHKLELVKNAEKILQQQMKRIEETKEILSKSMGGLTVQIEKARENQNKAQNNATELSAMSQLLIDNEIQQNHTRLMSLEERYFVTLENDKSALLEKIEANRLQQIDVEKQNNILKQKFDQLLLDNELQIEQQRLVIDKSNLDVDRTKYTHQNAISEQRQRIKEIKTKLENYNETRAVSSPVMSLKPAGLTKNKLMLIFIIIALFMGFIAVLMKLFADKVKQRRLELA